MEDHDELVNTMTDTELVPDKVKEESCVMKDPVLEGARKDILAQKDLCIRKAEVKVLIVYTGGTFGMMKTPEGYAPKKNWLLSRIQSGKLFFDEEYTKNNHISKTSCTPETLQGHRLRYHLIEYDQIIDSSELNSRHYTMIAETIEENYDKYDSFIIIYGTDTMAYMASQLSFMFENLNKTVVITGSQIPISEWRNDAESNLVGAFTVAEHMIPEVVVFFNGRLYRGNRICKESSTNLKAFGSPNFPELAKFDVFLNYRRDLIRRPPKEGDKFQVFKLLERRIALIYMHPLITSSIFLSAFKRAKAIVLQTYGMGNFPLSRVDLLEVLEDAILKYQKTVVIVSQCRTGFVRSSYASCTELKKLGAVLAEDMTIEAVIAKLSYILGKGFKGPDIKKQMMTDLRGEITIEKILSGEEEESAKISRFLASLGGSSDKSSPQDLNTISKLIQPLVIQTAALEGNISRIQNLLDQGVDINATCKNGDTALHIAVRNNDHNLVEFLLRQAETNLSLIDKSGNSPLFYACLNGCESIANMLLERNAKFITDEINLADVLCKKAKINDILSITLFHKAGANMELTNYDKRTLAHISAAENHEQILQYLAKNTDFNFELKDRYEHTPIDEIKDDTLRQTVRQLYISKKSNGTLE